LEDAAKFSFRAAVSGLFEAPLLLFGSVFAKFSVFSTDVVRAKRIDRGGISR